MQAAETDNRRLKSPRVSTKLTRKSTNLGGEPRPLQPQTTQRASPVIEQTPMKKQNSQFAFEKLDFSADAAFSEPEYVQ